MESGRTPRIDCLSDREIEVLRLISEGLSLDEIAKRLHRSVDTVKSHRRRIGSKLGARNRAELIKIGIEAGLVSLNLEHLAGDHASLLTTLDHHAVPACIVDAEGAVVVRNGQFERLAPKGHDSAEDLHAEQVFASGGRAWAGRFLASAVEAGFAYTTTRLLTSDEPVGVRVCRCSMGSGPARLLLLVEPGRSDGPSRSPVLGASTPGAGYSEQQNSLLKLVADSTLYSTEGGVFAVLLWRLTKVLDASHAVLMEFSREPGTPTRTITVWSRDQGLEQRPIDLDGPRRALHAGQPVHIADDLPEMYPALGSGPLSAARSMLAVPITGATGRLAGGLAVFADRPWPEAQDGFSVLRVVSGRLSCEFERNHCERRIAEQEYRLAQLNDLVPTGTFRTDRSGDLVSCNAALTGVLGMPRDHCIGRGWLQAVHRDDRKECERLLEVTETERAGEARVRLAGPDGGARWAVLRVVADVDEAGERIGAMGALAEVAERSAPRCVGTQDGPGDDGLPWPQCAEPFLRLSLDPIGRIIRSSHPERLARAERKADSAPHELAELVAQGDREHVHRLLARTLTGRGIASGVVRLREAGAGPMWARLCMRPSASTESGAVMEILAVLWDDTEAWLRQMITACARMGWAAAEREHHDGRLPGFSDLESARFGVVCTDAWGTMLAANAAARKWLGIPREHLGRATVCDVRTAPGFRTGSELFAESAAARGGAGIVHLLVDDRILRVRYSGQPTPCGLHIGILST